MNKKINIFITLFILLIMTGCTKINNNIDGIIDNILSTKQAVNTASTNYEFYLPNNIIVKEDRDYNQVLKIKDTVLYLYVDVTSYYYKNKLNFPKDINFTYYKELKYNDLEGYIGINKESDDLYYCKIIYNYSKIEFYSNKENLENIVVNSLMIINSIKYNDNLIKLSLGEDNSSGKEFTYELDTPSDTKSTFLETLQEYVVEEENVVELPDTE